MENVKIGTRIICVDDTNQLYGGLVEGRIYTVIYVNYTDGILSGLFVQGFDYPHKEERFKVYEDDGFAENLLKRITQEVKDELGNI